MATQPVSGSTATATPTPSNVFEATGMKKDKSKNMVSKTNRTYDELADVNGDGVDEVEAKFHLWYFTGATKEEKQKYPITKADRDHFIALCEDGLKKALALKYPDNSFYLDEKSYALFDSASNFAEVGLYDRAIEVAHMNRDKKLKGSAIRNICVSLANEGFYDRAVKLALTNGYEPERSASLGVIALRKAEHVSFEEGLKFIVTHHHNIEDFYQSEALGDIYDLMIGRGMKEPEIETVFKNHGFKVSDKDKFVVQSSIDEPRVHPKKNKLRVKSDEVK